MRKEMKIMVNGRQLGYYGFENSANAVILLDVSGTNVQIPKLNMSFTNLIKMHASYNGMTNIDDIGSDTFPSLKFLNLSHNAIASLKSIVFSHLSELEVLDLSHNCLTHFNYDHMFLKHENVKKIYLHDNLLHKVHGIAGFNHLLHLDVLNLARNFIEEFNDFNIEIQELNLEKNLLKSLLIHHANGMTLTANHNNIVSFSADGSFKFLDLSFNNIKFLSEIQIRNAKKLILSHNQIENWSKMTFSDESSESSLEIHNGIATEIFDLSYNYLTSISALRHFKNAISINLEGNKMNNIDIEDIRVKFPNLTYLNFIKNPITDIDRDEMKFHNNTRFLNLHIDYEIVTQKPILSPLLVPIITTTTTLAPTTTTEEEVTEIDDNNGVSFEYQNEQPQMWFLIFSALLISIFIVSIIYYYKRRSKRLMRAMKREFNEAENFQF
ncbi:hypothetical protein PVAND_003260 [Polypedilum vanderplanki]|uniref:Uncharacterized protein n=1 Tax=Polypedilum vanderplanki TaxID=319348 RepID=A0A9J6BTI2_POLVA|nr:hypothetical protein PVAND_003260 [Polypedilum vanderplanki]